MTLGKLLIIFKTIIMKLIHHEQIEECHGLHDKGSTEIIWEDGDFPYIMESELFFKTEYENEHIDRFGKVLSDKDILHKFFDMDKQELFNYVENNYTHDQILSFFN